LLALPDPTALSGPEQEDGGLVSAYWIEMGILLPLAHVSHWLWLLYVPPVLIVLASIVRTTLSERRKRD
jgi:hypothetical protein